MKSRPDGFETRLTAPPAACRWRAAAVYLFDMNSENRITPHARAKKDLPNPDRASRMRAFLKSRILKE